MRIEKLRHMDGWGVSVDADELQCDVRALPYPARIGIITKRGGVQVWTPAASVPRGYKGAARDMLEQAREELIASGELRAKGRPGDYRDELKLKAIHRKHAGAYDRAYGKRRR